MIAAAVGSISVGFVPFFAVALQRAGMDTVSLLLWRYLIALAILIPLALTFHRLADEWQRGGRWLVLNAPTTLRSRIARSSAGCIWSTPVPPPT